VANIAQVVFYNTTSKEVTYGNTISVAGNITAGNISTGIITLTNGAVIKDTAGDAVAFGQNAGETTQGTSAVAIGTNAGSNTQGDNSVAIGYNAGETTQGNSAVAIGYGAGGTAQGLHGVAVGLDAGYYNQGVAAVAIGTGAGATDQGNNSIILNATGATLNQTVANTFTVAPVRNDTSNIAEVMFYNNTSKEVTYGNTISVAGNITGDYILGNGSGLTSLPAPTVTPDISSNGDMSIMTYDGVIRSVNYATVEPSSGNIKGGNISTTGIVSANTANITTGNITTINSGLLQNGNSNITITSNGNVSIQSAGSNVELVVTSTGANVTGTFNATGNISGGNISATGNISANNFTGNGGTLSNVATKVEGSWTLASGVNTVNISVPLNGTYTIWVNGNIPNGIVTYTATGVVTNTNVPVLGEQYGWYYEAGNALVLTSIPNQFVGTQGAISNASPYAGNTANVFTFGITNNSGNTAVVNYGYTKL
jgi:hypothetical protein